MPYPASARTAPLSQSQAFRVPAGKFCLRRDLEPSRYTIQDNRELKAKESRSAARMILPVGVVPSTWENIYKNADSILTKDKIKKQGSAFKSNWKNDSNGRAEMAEATCQLFEWTLFHLGQHRGSTSTCNAFYIEDMFFPGYDINSYHYRFDFLLLSLKKQHDIKVIREQNPHLFRPHPARDLRELAISKHDNRPDRNPGPQNSVRQPTHIPNQSMFGSFQVAVSGGPQGGVSSQPAPMSDERNSFQGGMSGGSQGGVSSQPAYMPNESANTTPGMEIDPQLLLFDESLLGHMPNESANTTPDMDNGLPLPAEKGVYASPYPQIESQPFNKRVLKKLYSSKSMCTAPPYEADLQESAPIIGKCMLCTSSKVGMLETAYASSHKGKPQDLIGDVFEFCDGEGMTAVDLVHSEEAVDMKDGTSALCETRTWYRSIPQVNYITGKPSNEHEYHQFMVCKCCAHKLFVDHMIDSFTCSLAKFNQFCAACGCESRETEDARNVRKNREAQSFLWTSLR